MASSTTSDALRPREAEPAEDGISQRLARFAVERNRLIVPPSARAIAKLSLFDWSTVALAGVDEPVSRIVRQMVAEEAGSPEATLIGAGRRLPARAAALANGTSSHALDYDDTHFDYIGHPSVAVAPAVLAVAEKVGAGGAELLEAFLVGVETACRLGQYLGRAHYQHGFHQTATAGAFGAAAGCSRLLSLTVPEAACALGIAATRAAGLKSQFGTMGKPYHAGAAAANGVEAATLARLGFVSRGNAIECEQGFAATHAAAPDDLEAVLTGLGETFRFERIQYKYHACCHGTHASLEALKALLRDSTIDADDVRAVTLRVHPRWLGVCNIERPATGLEAKFSFKLTAAMVLAGLDTGALETFRADSCRRPDLVRLRDLVRVETDDTLSDTQSDVRLWLRDGKTVQARFDLDGVVPVHAQATRLRGKAKTLIGASLADDLWRVIADLDTLPVASLVERLAAPPEEHVGH